jgi:nucleotide-binding universal stress UspA family protein
VRGILLAIDDSECSLRAIEYCGRQFSGLPGLSLVLLHVLPNLPPRFWDPGHLLDRQEQEGRKKIVEGWIEHQKTIIEPMFQAAISALTKWGIEAEGISTKTVYDSTDIAASILEQARDGQYLTLVLGRCSSGRGGFSMGSTTSRIINRALGLAICVVD